MQAFGEKEVLLPVLRKEGGTESGAATLEEVYQAHYRRVFRAAYRLTGNASDAEDVLQTVFLRLARREDGAAEVENLESYLYRAALNAALDLVRARRNAPQVALDDVGPAPSSADLDAPERQLASRDLRDRLRAALAKLHPRTAQVFALRYLEDFDNGQIAQLLNTSAAVVAVTLHRARTQLKRELKAYRGEWR